ncbi:hypothetical protein V5799_021329 [Amblyomma americanum]|uniref:Uncharacterized protein n=1 Tax=Amblyomma americanum TaxID=6943 RepID=A0AAQ4FQ41_AMBAM
MPKKPRVKKTSGGRPEDAATAAATQRPQKTRPAKTAAPAPPAKGGKQQPASTSATSSQLEHASPIRSPQNYRVPRDASPSATKKAKWAAANRTQVVAPERPDPSPPKNGEARPAADVFRGGIRQAPTPKRRAAAHGSPDRSQPNNGEVSPGVPHGSADSSPGPAREKQPAPLKSRGRPKAKRAAELAGARAKAGASDATTQEVEQAAKPARAAKRTRAATAVVTVPSSPQPSAEEPPAKRPAAAKSSSGEVSPGVPHGSADSSPAPAREKQPEPPKSRGRPKAKRAAELVGARAKAGASDATTQEVEQQAKPAGAAKRSRAATAEITVVPSSPQPSAEEPPAKRAAAAKSSKVSEKARAGTSQPKQAARPVSATADVEADVTTTETSASQRPSSDKAGKKTLKANAKKSPTKDQTNLPSLSSASQGPSADKPEKTTSKASTKKMPTKGRTSLALQSTGQKARKKPAANGRPAQKRAQRKQKDGDNEVSSDASNSSYKVPRGLLQRAKRKERFYDYVWPSEEDDSGSDSEDISHASINSIIPPAGLLQPYRTKQRRLIAVGSGDSSSDDADDDDMDVSPGEDLLSRCEALFGMDTLPNSTTTRAEAVSMLLTFASNRQLRWGALAELVTIVNKLFAPAKDVLPGRKALAKMLSQMP